MRIKAIATMDTMYEVGAGTKIVTPQGLGINPILVTQSIEVHETQAEVVMHDTKRMRKFVRVIPMAQVHFWEIDAEEARGVIEVASA